MCLNEQKIRIAISSTDAPWYVKNAVIKRDLQVLPARQEVRNCSVTYRQKLQCHLPTKSRRSPQQPGTIGISKTKLQS